MKLRRGARVHDVVRKSDHAFEVDGERVDAWVAPGTAPHFDGQVGSRRAGVFVVRDGDRVFAQVDGRAYTFSVVGRALTGESSDSASLGGLEAPMPGRVTRVAVAVGDAVKRGQELIVVEAMKMENALIAPSDGVVKSIAVKVGDMVAPGPPLIVIEAAR